MLRSSMVWLKRDSVTLVAKHARPRPQPGDAKASVPPAPEVLSKVRRLLEGGRFPPGTALPAERPLAAELGVGRPALREAIKALNVLGILESRRGSGTYVKATEAAEDSPLFAAAAGNMGFGVLDLLEVREILEPRAAWLAATRAGEKHLLEIESARRRLEMHDRDWKLVDRLDYDLHSAIFRGAQNPVLELIHKFLMSRMPGSRSGNVRFAPDVEGMRRDHRAIVEAILKRQSGNAEKAMIDHLHSVRMEFITEAKR